MLAKLRNFNMETVCVCDLPLMKKMPEVLTWKGDMFSFATFEISEDQKEVLCALYCQVCFYDIKGDDVTFFKEV